MKLNRQASVALPGPGPASIVTCDTPCAQSVLALASMSALRMATRANGCTWCRLNSTHLGSFSLATPAFPVIASAVECFGTESWRTTRSEFSSTSIPLHTLLLQIHARNPEITQRQPSRTRCRSIPSARMWCYQRRLCTLGSGVTRAWHRTTRPVLVQL